MPYSELIKNFQRIRNYMKEFYIYGFKTREQYDKKSGRSYDNEKRRIESYLGEYMEFRQTQDGKNVFLSIDTRSSKSNPLYKALKSKSFTDGDVTLHFILFDILFSPEVSMTISEIAEIIDHEYLNKFSSVSVFDESTIRKKVKEYVKLGLIKCQKQGKKMLYSRTDNNNMAPSADAVEFFSEVGGCGVIGSYILDKLENQNNVFSFKHHYIAGAIDSEVLCVLLDSIHSKRYVEIIYETRGLSQENIIQLNPLKIFVSSQNGRQYLFGYNPKINKIKAYRIDYIRVAKQGEPAQDFDCLLSRLENIRKHLWGVSLGKKDQTEHVEFTIKFSENEEYIYRRLLREKRCGSVVKYDNNTCVFSADVYDTVEMIPWMRTFICRITALNFSNRTVENQFKKDIESMYSLYNIEGGL